MAECYGATAGVDFLDVYVKDLSKREGRRSRVSQKTMFLQEIGGEGNIIP